MKHGFKISKISGLALAMFFTLAFASCKKKTELTQPVYVAPPLKNLKLMRLEKDLFSINPMELEQELGKVSRKFGPFYYSYAADILAMPDEGDSLFSRSMRLMLSYQPLINLHKTVDSAFGDISDIEQQLQMAMGIYEQQFPDSAAPEFITFISEFGYANVTFEKQIGIGLDMFLKERFKEYYQWLEFPEFMIRKLSRAYIVPYAIKAMGTAMVEDQSTRDKRFLAMMLVEGKVRFFMKALQPDVHDSIILGYTAQQLQWSKENESEIWRHYIDKELLYKNEPSQFIRYFTDGPFTAAEGVPQESAPMIGTYTGLQILRHYIKNNPEVSLKELMFETDFDKILKLSKYRP
jgi:hypothetical protein